VRRDDFARLMGRAIEAALVRRGGLSPERARLLRNDALLRFTTLFGMGTKRVRALTRNEVVAEFERTHGEILRRRQDWNGELDGLEQELALARSAGEGDGALTIAEENALQQALAADLERVLPARGARVDLAGILERERQRRAQALAGVVQRERERIDQLERRMAKLREEVVHLQEQLADVARQAQIDPGLPSIYRTVQGLSSAEADRAAKAAMLTRIFEQNLILQKGA
jgi:hypothetical protein